MSVYFNEGQLLQIFNEAGLNPNKVRSIENTRVLSALIDTAIGKFIEVQNAKHFVPNDDYFRELGYLWDNHVCNHDLDDGQIADINRDVFNTGMYHGVQQAYESLGIAQEQQTYRYIGARPNCPPYRLLMKGVSPAGLARQEGMEGITVYQDSETKKWWYRFDADFIDRMEPQK